MSLASDDPEHVIVVPGRHLAPTTSAGPAAAASGGEIEGNIPIVVSKMADGMQCVHKTDVFETAGEVTLILLAASADRRHLV